MATSVYSFPSLSGEQNLADQLRLVQATQVHPRLDARYARFTRAVFLRSPACNVVHPGFLARGCPHRARHSRHKPRIRRVAPVRSGGCGTQPSSIGGSGPQPPVPRPGNAGRFPCTRVKGMRIRAGAPPWPGRRDLVHRPGNAGTPPARRIAPFLPLPAIRPRNHIRARTRKPWHTGQPPPGASRGNLTDTPATLNNPQAKDAACRLLI